MKYQVFKAQPLRKVMNALPKKYREQMKPSDETISAIYYPKDHFAVTSTLAIKGIEKLGETEHRKIAIARNFTDEAIAIFQEHDFSLVLHSRVPVADDQVFKKAHESK